MSRIKNNLFKPLQNMTQAERIIHKFGGVANLFKMLKIIKRPVSMPTIYSWLKTSPQIKGLQGNIPYRYLDAIFEAAIYDGIILKPADVDPRALPYDGYFWETAEYLEKHDLCVRSGDKRRMCDIDAQENGIGWVSEHDRTYHTDRSATSKVIKKRRERAKRQKEIYKFITSGKDSETIRGPY